MFILTKPILLCLAFYLQVGLGVITESEIDNQGIEKIMDHMYQYAPHHNEEPIPIFSIGDQLTCERESNIQESRRGSKPRLRWAGLLPEIADFHALGNFYEVRTIH